MFVNYVKKVFYTKKVIILTIIINVCNYINEGFIIG